jgi:2-hydroxychromene-2-carboxylate isomerase
MGAPATTFYYDFNSPYSYLAAHRVEAGALPGEVRWAPIAFGVLIRELGRVPWSLASPASAADGKAICEARAAELGLPPIVWQAGWPAESYSILVLRAALVAEELGALPAFTLAAYEQNFVVGAPLREPATIAAAARAAGLDPEAVIGGAERQDIKDRLREVTAAAIGRGVTGVPTFEVDGELFWGDDRIDEAAAAG